MTGILGSFTLRSNTFSFGPKVNCTGMKSELEKPSWITADVETSWKPVSFSSSFPFLSFPNVSLCHVSRSSPVIAIQPSTLRASDSLNRLTMFPLVMKQLALLELKYTPLKSTSGLTPALLPKVGPDCPKPTQTALSPVRSFLLLSFPNSPPFSVYFFFTRQQLLRSFLHKGTLICRPGVPHASTFVQLVNVWLLQ